MPDPAAENVNVPIRRAVGEYRFDPHHAGVCLARTDNRQLRYAAAIDNTADCASPIDERSVQARRCDKPRGISARAFKIDILGKVQRPGLVCTGRQIHGPAARSADGIDCRLYRRGIGRRVIADSAEVLCADGIAQLGLHRPRNRVSARLDETNDGSPSGRGKGPRRAASNRVNIL